MPETPNGQAQLDGLRVRLKDIDRRIRALLVSVDGLLLFLTCAGVGILLGVVVAAYLEGESGLAMLFLAILIIAVPFAGLVVARAARPLWRLATDRAQLRDQAEQVRATLGLPGRYTPPPPPPAQPPAKTTQAARRGLDPFTASGR